MSRLVLAGAGHVHLGLFSRLPRLHSRGHQVTVISRSPDYCYSGMAPGVLGGEYEGSDFILDAKSIVERSGARFLTAAVTHIDAARRILILDNGSEEPYDVASFNIGSVVPVSNLRLDPRFSITAKPIHNFLEMRNRVESLLSGKRPIHILVAGGGPAGLEISSNLCRLAARCHGVMNITLLSSGPLMPGIPPGAARAAREALRRGGVRFLEGCRLHSVENVRARIEGAPDMDIDLAIIAVGVKPQSLFRDSGLPTAPDGGLLVNRFLQCPSHPEIFGGGDCVTLEQGRSPRIGVVACRQNPVISRNAAAALEGKPLSGFHPRKNYLQIYNLGKARGLLVMGRLWFKGRAAFALKNAIDRRFIRRLKKSLGLVGTPTPPGGFNVSNMSAVTGDAK